MKMTELLGQAAVNLAVAERRAKDAEDERDSLAELLAAAYAEGDVAETQRLAYAKQVTVATEALRMEHAVALATAKQNAKTVLESLEKAYGWLTTACAARDEAREALMQTGADLVAVAQRAAAAEAREARERAALASYGVHDPSCVWRNCLCPTLCRCSCGLADALGED